MVLATSKIEDFDRFWNAFSTKGAEKRKQHGSKGSHVFRDPNDDRRVWVVFDWDEEGFRNLLSDPDMPAIFEEGGLQGPPQPAEFAREHDAQSKAELTERVPEKALEAAGLREQAMSQENVEIVRRVIEAWNRNEQERVVPLERVVPFLDTA